MRSHIAEVTTASPSGYDSDDIVLETHIFNVPHSSLQHSLSSVRADKEDLQTPIFKYCHTFSIRLSVNSSIIPLISRLWVHRAIGQWEKPRHSSCSDILQRPLCFPPDMSHLINYQMGHVIPPVFPRVSPSATYQENLQGKRCLNHLDQPHLMQRRTLLSTLSFNWITELLSVFKAADLSQTTEEIHFRCLNFGYHSFGYDPYLKTIAEGQNIDSPVNHKLCFLTQLFAQHNCLEHCLKFCSWSHK